MTNSHWLQTNSMPDSIVTAASSISDVARTVGLSRARFYQLVKDGVFPSPVYDIRTRRPYYTDEQQRICLEVRRRNLGINGRAVLFYARRKAPFARKTTSAARRSSKSKQSSRWSSIVEGLKSLGLDGVTSAQIDPIIRLSFPMGTDNIDDGDLIRCCYRKLRKRRNTTDNVG